LLGTALGDAAGLPYEGMTRARTARFYPRAFLLGRNMTSDDTEHACIAAQALIGSAGDEQEFERRMARGLKWWLAALPAGTGWATLRACVRLACGVPPGRSGVFSAGAGPAMRSTILGAAVADPDRMRRLVRLSTRLTHTDPKAEFAAQGAAFAAWTAAHRPEATPDEFLGALRSFFLDQPAEEWVWLVERAVSSVGRGESTGKFARTRGLEMGVSGYCYHAVPVAIHAWLSRRWDFRAAIEACVRCGGDTDTTAAIAGGILGAGLGRDGLPAEWLRALRDPPRSVEWIERLGRQLSEVAESGAAQEPLRLPVVALLARNALFGAAAVAHGLRRLAPPYG
jgi:ADP-ribosylglycohydrolase